MKYNKGMIFSVDPENVFGQDATGVMAVELLQRQKKKPFGRSIWLCKNLDEYSNMKQVAVEEKFLYPINTAVLRISVDTPMINSNDLRILSSAIEYLEREGKSSAINDLKALYEKLNFYSKFKEV